ncbi:MAG: gliding motility-associated C-terminal domain-containing protein, partial [Flavobacteriales bacterium]
YLGFDSYNLLIYNRWGDIVFESNDRDIHWNGDFNNKIVSQGVYFYVLSIGEKRHKGNVSVFR